LNFAYIGNNNQSDASEGSAEHNGRPSGSDDDEAPCKKCLILKHRVPRIVLSRAASKQEREICGDIWKLHCNECNSLVEFPIALSPGGEETADEDDDVEESLVSQSPATLDDDDGGLAHQAQHSPHHPPPRTASTSTASPSASGPAATAVANVDEEEVSVTRKTRGLHSN
jgi:hypothetical protein